MRVFKTKEFARFTRIEGIADSELCEAVARASRGLVDAALGADLIKQRLPRPGQGRSGGFRTIIAIRLKDRAVFLFGFAKNVRANIGAKDLARLRSLGVAILAINAARVAAELKAKTLIEVNCDD